MIGKLESDYMNIILKYLVDKLNSSINNQFQNFSSIRMIIFSIFVIFIFGIYIFFWMPIFNEFNLKVNFLLLI